MYEPIEGAPALAYDGRSFQRIPVPAFSGFEVALGPLGKPPAASTPVNVSRGGMQMRTGVGMFEGAEGTECLIRFRDPHSRLTPDRALGWVRRVEERGGYFLVAVEFSHPLERLSF